MVGHLTLTYGRRMLHHQSYDTDAPQATLSTAPQAPLPLAAMASGVGNAAFARMAAVSAPTQLARQPAPATAPSAAQSPPAFDPNKRHSAPVYALAGRLGAGQIEDIGDTENLVGEIESLLAPAFRSGASPAIGMLRTKFSADNVRNQLANMVQGAGLTATGFIGGDAMHDYRGDVTVTARLSNFQFLRGDLTKLSNSSASTPVATGTTTQTTGVTGTAEGSASDGTAGAKATGGVSTSTAQGTTAGMTGTTTRAAELPPGSVLFTCDIEYRIEHTWHRDPSTLSKALSPMAAMIHHAAGGTDGRQTRRTTSKGLRVRFPGLDCPPE